jgi:hypothetical protein
LPEEDVVSLDDVLEDGVALVVLLLLLGLLVLDDDEDDDGWLDDEVDGVSEPLELDVLDEPEWTFMVRRAPGLGSRKP